MRRVGCPDDADWLATGDPTPGVGRGGAAPETCVPWPFREEYPGGRRSGLDAVAEV